MTDFISDLLGRNGHFGKKWRFFEVFIKIHWPKIAVSDANAACFYSKLGRNLISFTKDLR